MADFSTNGHSQRRPVMGEAAYRGLAGDVVRTLAPETEADPVALLADFLATFGNIVGGNGPHMAIRFAKQAPRIWPLIVGRTGDRKGQSRSEIQGLCRIVDEQWDRERLRSGLSSGEGLITACADDPDATEDDDVDKRLLVVEEEFSRVLKVCGRDGNTLSENLRQAWDGKKMQILRVKPIVATGAHVTIVAHITPEELRHRLSQVDQANGFANRFLLFSVRRAQILPRGGTLDMRQIYALASQVNAAVQDARTRGEMFRSPEAEEFWAPIYGSFYGEREGLRWAMIARGDAQLVRLQLLYALLDRSPMIEIEHIESAFAVWKYVEDSINLTFSAGVYGDPDIDMLLQAIVDSGGHGLDRTQQIRLFSKHRSREELDAMRARLEESGAIRREIVQTRGRPREIWLAK